MSTPVLQGALRAYAPARRTLDLRIGTRIDAHLRLWCLALVCYLGAMAWLMGAGGDFAVADRLYALQGGAWQLQKYWLTEGWIHVGGKRLSWLLWLGSLGFTAWAWRRSQWRSWRRPLVVLLVSVLLSTSVVAMIKHALPMQCPWGLQRYGGSGAYIALFEAWPAGVARNACFPAAHASAGFAWIALYFFLLQVRPRWRWHGLALGLAMGTIFAASQELRGAHFLSHDLTTIMICWSVSLGLYVLTMRAATR